MRRREANQTSMGREEKEGQSGQLYDPFQRWHGPSIQGDSACKPDGAAGMPLYCNGLRRRGTLEGGEIVLV